MKNAIKILIICLLTQITLYSQTKELARKSHQKALFEPNDMAETYGAIPYYIISTHYKKIKSCTIEVTQRTTEGNEIDTFYNHPILCNPKLKLDTIKKYYNEKDNTFEGFSIIIDSFGKRGIIKNALLSTEITNGQLILLICVSAFISISYWSKKKENVQ
jgi:hypothetical protein